MTAFLKILRVLLISILGFILSCSKEKETKTEIKTLLKIEEQENIVQISSLEKVALEFINNYTENCNKLNNSMGVVEWVNSYSNSSNTLKSELNRIMEKAEKEDPEYGLGFDPIFNAQDFPDEGFQLVRSDYEKGIVIVRDKILEGFEMKIKLVKEKDRWLVNSVGIINM